MRTDIYQDRTREDGCIAHTDIDPAELWLDQDITGEELIGLDPLEDPEILIALADEATGDFLKGLWLKPTSRGGLLAKNGAETAADFIKRIRGSSETTSSSSCVTVRFKEQGCREVTHVMRDSLPCLARQGITELVTMERTKMVGFDVVAAARDGGSVRPRVTADPVAFGDVAENHQEITFPNYGCPRCGSHRGQWRGYRKRHKRVTIHRRRCNSCGAWYAR